MQGAWLIAFIVQWVMMLILALLVAGILRHLAIMQERWNLAAPPITAYELGQPIADFELPDATGTKVKSNDLLHQSDGAVILFVSTNCSSCATLLAQVSELVARPDVSLTKIIVVIVLGAVSSLERLSIEYPNLVNTHVVALADENATAVGQFGIRFVPIGLLVDREGHVSNQTLNPHAANWLYTVVGAIPPLEPVSRGAMGLVLPAAYLERKG